jgi:hypothetical protein
MALLMQKSTIYAGMLFASQLCGCDHQAPAVTEVKAPVIAASVPPAEDTGPVPSAAPPSGKRSPCTTDQSCNGNPSVSALWGHCVKESGVCECNTGFELHPGGYCQPIAK